MPHTGAHLANEERPAFPDERTAMCARTLSEVVRSTYPLMQVHAQVYMRLRAPMMTLIAGGVFEQVQRARHRQPEGGITHIQTTA